MGSVHEGPDTDARNCAEGYETLVLGSVGTSLLSSEIMLLGRSDLDPEKDCSGVNDHAV